MSEVKLNKKPQTGGGNRKMGLPIFKVLSGGVCVDVTDKLSEAMGSFKDASTGPKEVWSINGPAISLVAASNIR